MINLDVVTPVGMVVDEDVDEVYIPGALGEFGVLEGHLPLLSAVRPGVLHYKKDGQEHALAVARGFAEVGAAEHVLVLTDRSATPGEIDLQQVETELAELEAELNAWSGETDTAEFKVLRERIRWAQARITLKQQF